MKEMLYANADEKYRKFTSKLLPGVNNIIGVRLPLLRQLAKDIVNDEPLHYLASATDDTFEEVMLQAFVVAAMPYDEARIEEFVKKITNWSVCDSFCNSLKSVKQHRSSMWQVIQRYFYSPQLYDVRFAVVMTLNYYVDEAYINEALEHFTKIEATEYYVSMAVAWGIATYYTAFPERTYAYLTQQMLDDRTHRLAIQKIVDASRILPENKELAKQLRRNRKGEMV